MPHPQTTSNADVWEMYSEYHFSSEDRAEQEKVREREKQERERWREGRREHEG